MSRFMEGLLVGCVCMYFWGPLRWEKNDPNRPSTKLEDSLFRDVNMLHVNVAECHVELENLRKKQ